MESNIAYLQCVTCKKEYDADKIEYTCPDCGLVKGTLDVNYNYKKVKKQLSKEALAQTGEASHWRYLPLLPVNDPQFIQPLKVGWTPLYQHKRLNGIIGLPELFLKDDSGNVTASYKDRASSVAIVKALEKGYKGVATASCGNAAASIAAFAASAGLPCYLFVPASIPNGKLAQLKAYNAQVMFVEAGYDAAFDMCMKEAQKNNWYNRNTAINPYLAEGKKSAALEICEQLNWQAPDIVVVPVGDGCIISGLWKGFKDLHEIGFIENFPQIVGVQAEGSSPLVRAFRNGRGVEIGQNAHTIADSIAVGFPRDQVKALRAVHQSGGTFIAVSDEEILSALKLLSIKAGIFVEPAAAASLAGILKMTESKKIKQDKKVVAMLTGSGLKDIKAVLE